eukprot:c7530_g1_i1.p1 GENE.c7530_g1_i1~~c7530_g1_i1.p1  ORF type:complete len:148 (-),score=10.95 c7530_g1_i1:346-789(-)
MGGQRTRDGIQHIRPPQQGAVVRTSLTSTNKKLQHMIKRKKGDDVLGRVSFSAPPPLAVEFTVDQHRGESAVPRRNAPLQKQESVVMRAFCSTAPFGLFERSGFERWGNRDCVWRAVIKARSTSDFALEKHAWDIPNTSSMPRSCSA